MAGHTVNLSSNAFERLKRLKRPGESFSDVVNRLAGRFAIKDLVGILSEDAAHELEGHVAEFRRRMDADIRGRQPGR